MKTIENRSVEHSEPQVLFSVDYFCPANYGEVKINRERY